MIGHTGTTHVAAGQDTGVYLLEFCGLAIRRVRNRSIPLTLVRTPVGRRCSAPASWQKKAAPRRAFAHVLQQFEPFQRPDGAWSLIHGHLPSRLEKSRSSGPVFFSAVNATAENHQATSTTLLECSMRSKSFAVASSSPSGLDRDRSGC